MTTLEREAADCYYGYHEAFVQAGKTKDVTRLRPFTHVPLTAVVAGRLAVFQTEQESDARWARILGDLPEDYDHSVAHSVDVTMISAMSALITVDVSRLKRSGDEYGRFRQSYILIKTEAGWKIATWLVHDSMEDLHTQRF